MQSSYIDQVQKLDVQSLMARALKDARVQNYVLKVVMEKWPQIKDQADSSLLTVEIQLDRPAELPASEPVSGLITLRFTMPDGRKREQWLQLEGVPTAKRGWRWKIAWPCGERAQTLYFHRSNEQFDSRKSAGLKYRRKLSARSGRHLQRIQLYLKELQSDYFDPYIPKPLWMTEDRYQYLLQELNKEYIRLASPLLGLPVMEFCDDDIESLPDAIAELLPLKDPQSLAMCYHDRDGTLKIKAKYERKYGLPPDALPDLPIHLWFALPKTAAR